MAHFFEQPILNSPYVHPARHWELDKSGQPPQHIIEKRRSAEFITPIPKPRKRKGSAEQESLLFDEGKGLSTRDQQYIHTAIINGVREQVDQWRAIPSPDNWRVTPETARLLQHWRHHQFSGIRPFFCQLEAIETAIWLTEVAPIIGKAGERFIEHITNTNRDGKTTVMAMLMVSSRLYGARRRQCHCDTIGRRVLYDPGRRHTSTST